MQVCGIPIDLLPLRNTFKTSMVHIPPRNIFKKALWILLYRQKNLEFTIFPDSISLRLPVQRDLSQYCSVSKSGLTEVLHDMERQDLIKKEERVGIWTTPKGNRVVADVIERHYRTQATRLLGANMVHLILERLRASLPETWELSDDKDHVKLPAKHQKMPYSPRRKIMRTHICVSCNCEFYSNDMRRRHCDRCKSLSSYDKMRIRKKTEYRGKKFNSVNLKDFRP